MESVESPLEVLSRAATMMQHRHAYPASDSESFGSPSTASGGESEREETAPPAAAASAVPDAARSTKQLPSAKWRRERRSTRLPDYKPRENGNKALRSQSFNERRGGGGAGAGAGAGVARGRGSARSDGESPDEEASPPPPPPPSVALNGARPLAVRGAPPDYPSEAPIDMRLKCRSTLPPPPYPLAAAATAAATTAASSANRATVITHAPHDAPPGAGSMSMCDPVIDEHFRRSLGDDYMTLFTKRTPEAKKTKDRGSSPIRFPSDPCANFLPQDKPRVEQKAAEKSPDDVKPVAKKTETVLCEDVAMEVDSAASSVDDHFAKALGDTWRKIQISRLEAERPGKKDKRTRPGVVI